MQVSSIGGDVQSNTKRIIDAIHVAQQNGAELIIFPELCVSGYGADDLFLKDQFLDSCQWALSQIAAHVKPQEVVLLGYPEKTDAGLYSSIAIMTDGKIVGNHRKTTIPSEKFCTEHRYFKSGEGSTTFDFKGLRIGILVSEEIFLDVDMVDCDLFCCCSAFPWSRELSIEREQCLHSLSRTTNAPIVYVNHVGVTRDFLLEGSSSITNEMGKTSVLLKFFEEDSVVVSMNQIKYHDHPIYPKPESYKQELYWAIKYVMKAFIEQTPEKKMLVLMDGTLNCQVILYIAMRALGADNVSGLYISSRFDSPKIQSQVKAFMDNLGAKLYVWELENDLVHGFIGQGGHIVDDVWKKEACDRFKAAMFISVAKLLQAFPVNSRHKTEVAMGVQENISSFAFTEFMPLSDVYYAQVIGLAECINKYKKAEIFSYEKLEYSHNLMVRKSFLNNGELAKVSDIDEILILYIERSQSVKQIINRGYDKDLVISVIRRLHQEEPNRVKLGFCPTLSLRSFQKDWLFPPLVDWNNIEITNL
nr:nitrilase-related carbon-nitrogen hydrolase [Wohlfahrtiimonas larvae]